MVQQLLHLSRKSIDAKCSHVRNLILISQLITEREISILGVGGEREREKKSLYCVHNSPLMYCHHIVPYQSFHLLNLCATLIAQ